MTSARSASRPFDEMERREWYLYLASDQCLSAYPDNECVDFTIDLAHPIRLHEGEWELALMRVDFRENRKDGGGLHLYVCCDLCECNMVGDGLYPVIGEHIIQHGGATRAAETKCTPLKYTLMRNMTQVSRVRLYIRSLSAIPASVLRAPLSCVLHLRLTN